MENSDEAYIILIALLGGFIGNLTAGAFLYWTHGQGNGGDIVIMGFFGNGLIVVIAALLWYQ